MLKLKLPFNLFKDPEYLASVECWKNIIVGSTLVKIYLSLDWPNDGKPERVILSVCKIILPEVSRSRILSIKLLHLPSHDKNEGVILVSALAVPI